jgi:hypothetical protein
MADETQVADAYGALGIDPGTGFAHDGEWPVNSRLRAEAMARGGVSTDPAGFISDDLIAETKGRLAEEAAEAERLTTEAKERDEAEAAKAPSSKWTLGDLAAEAARRGVTVEGDATKAAILAALNAAPAATTEG